MLRPFLYVGLGGSGGKTLRTLREDLLERLREVGWSGDFPSVWQFIHIDVPTDPDGDDPDLPPQLPGADYLGLVKKRVTYRVVDQALTRVIPRDIRAGWRPDPDQVLVDIERGAGQYRTLGRVIAATHLDAIWDAIRSAIAALQGPEVLKQTEELSRRFGAAATSGPVPAPQAILVSSIAGGSGAGAFLDVCDVLRASGESWASNSVGLLFAPDVFEHIPEPQRKGVYPNALASISELLAGFWGEGQHDLLRAQGIKPRDDARSGPRYPMLVGASNGRVTFSDQNAIYRAIGKALGAWTVSDRVQDRMDSVVSGNWASSASGPDRLFLKRTNQERPLSAIGFARVSLGRERFGRYVAERLARSAVERLLRRHLFEHGPDVNHAAALEEAATDSFAGFLAQSWLNERGEERNDILDALKPDNRKARMQQRVREICDRVTDGRTAALAVQQWLAAIREQVDFGMTDFAAEEHLLRIEKGRRWVVNIQHHLLEVTACSLARDGALVTEQLLDRLIHELEFVMDELRSEEGLHREWATKLGEMVAQAFPPAGESLLASHPAIEESVVQGVRCMEWRADADLRAFAVELIGDLRERFISPLRKAVGEARAALALDEQPKDGRPSMVSLWPDGARVPRSLAPPPNELLIEGTEAYADDFRRLVLQSTAAETPGNAETEAVAKVIMGTNDPDGKEQTVIELESAFVPTNHELQTGHAAATSASFRIHIGATQLLERARTWTRDGDHALAVHVGESLRSYLHDEKVPDAELSNRLSRFRVALAQAIDSAQPLVEFDSEALMAAHDVPEPKVSLVVSDVPFPAGSRAARVVEEVLFERGYWDAQSEKIFTDGDHARIDCFTVLGEPFEPWVFESIAGPIAREWVGKQHDADQRVEFWRWRRTRPLPHFLPLAPSVRLAMIRGWFTASLIGQLRLRDDGTEIFDPDRGSWVRFPWPMLGRALVVEYDRLPALLETLPIALVDWGTSGVSGESKIAAYRRLRTLGTSGDGAEQDYERPNLELGVWIRDGVVPPGADTPDPAHAGTTAGTSEERQELCRSRISTLLEKYRKLFHDCDARDDEFDMPRVYDLRGSYEKVLGDLIHAIDSMAPDDGDWT
jgi:hypothetical protein